MDNHYTTDDVTLNNAIDYALEIYDSQIIDPYIDHIDADSER